jgi:hypothetical protein
MSPGNDGEKEKVILKGRLIMGFRQLPTPRPATKPAAWEKTDRKDASKKPATKPCDK